MCDDPPWQTVAVGKADWPPAQQWYSCFSLLQRCEAAGALQTIEIQQTQIYASSACSYVQRAVRLKEAASRWFFQQLIIGLDYCHRRGVVNRDIKLENTLLQVGMQQASAVVADA